MKTDRKSFARRLNYRIKKYGKKTDNFMLQENTFGNGYLFVLRSTEFKIFADNLALAQRELQKKLSDYLKNNSYQTTL